MKVVEFKTYRLLWLIYVVPIIMIQFWGTYDSYLSDGAFHALRRLLTLGGLLGCFFFSIGARVLTRKFWQLYFCCMVVDELYGFAESTFFGEYNVIAIVISLLIILPGYFILFLYAFQNKSIWKDMLDQLSAVPYQPPTPLSPAVKLWTSRAISSTTMLFGFPSGIFMAVRNWMRMGLTNKAKIHLVLGAVGALTFVVLYLILPVSEIKALYFIVNIGALFYLQYQTEKDIETFKVNNREVQNAHWFGGCLIGIAMIVLLIILYFIVEFFLTLVGVRISK